jgi:phosphoheptose isomerase
MITRDIIRSQIEQSIEIHLASIEYLTDALVPAADIVINALQKGHKVLTCGNGGSAGDAQHMASELVNRFEHERMALASISLVPDSSVVTAIANDYSYEVLFSRQVEALGRQGDVLVVFSTSGNSKNVVLAIKSAHAIGMRVVAFTGKGGGFVAQTINTFDAEIRVKATGTARIQEVHLLGIHALCKTIDAHFVGSILEIPDKLQMDWNQLVNISNGLRPLVFTNGVFDILHRGHVCLLQEARRQGACLIVGINSDASVKRLGKGKDRPIQSTLDRASIMSALGCVDFVTIFEEDTPQKLIEAIVPDILVRRGDCKPDKIVGADFVLAHGGRIVTIDVDRDYSTTKLLRTIRESL